MTRRDDAKTISNKAIQPPSLSAALVAFAILLAFFVRIKEVGSLTLWGDSSYSVYTATRDLLSIATDRIYDGHPPLYYYLLHFWITLTGPSEFSLRMLSILFGVLTVSVTYKVAQIGQRLLQDEQTRDFNAGILAIYFVALSPTLIYYSRIVRMYSLFPLLALLSTYALMLSLRERRPHRWGIFIFSTLAALYTHYYALAIIAAQAVYVLAFHRKDKPFLRSWLISQSVIGAIYLPWVAYAAVTSATTTAKIISNAPPAEGFFGFIEEFWIPFNLGVTWNVDSARPISLILGILVVAAIAYLLRIKAFPLRSQAIAWLMVIVPIAVSFIMFWVLPYAVRNRFLVFAIPFYLILLSHIIVRLNRLRMLQVFLVAMILTNSCIAILQGQVIESMFMEADAVQIVDRIKTMARPGDAVVFHAAWQIGYLKAHYRGKGLPALYSLEELQENSFSLLNKHPRVWLAMYLAPQRDPRYPLEAWLDRHWHKAEQFDIPPTRLSLYVAPNIEPTFRLAADFALEDGQPGIRLDLVGLDYREISAGSTLAFSLRWQALRSIEKAYTVLVHIIDENGRRWAGRDSEPQEGVSPTNLWHPGQFVEDRRAILLPKNIPPGEYNVIVGIYNSEGKRLTVTGPSGKTSESVISIGTIRIRNSNTDNVSLKHRVNLPLIPQLVLLGYELDNDSVRLELKGVARGKLDTPQNLFARRKSYRPGEDIHLNLAWQIKDRPLDRMRLLLRLVDERGRVVSQALYRPFDGIYNSKLWQEGEILLDSYKLRIDDKIVDGQYSLQVEILPDSDEKSQIDQQIGSQAVTLTKIAVDRN